jgi:ABC-type antimicrobial peptide transport system permease subunit
MTFVRAQVIAVAGGLGGVGLAYPAGRILASTLYEVRAADPVILGSATLIVGAVAVLATVLPAHRAAHVDPIVALRAE